MEIFEDSSPFIYDEGQDRVVFRKDFGHLNPEAIYPEAEDWIDGHRIAKVTTWSHEKGPELEAASAYDTTIPLKDSIDFLFRSKMWILNPIVYISVFNSDPDKNGPVDFNIRMRDYLPAATYPEDVAQWAKLYDKALEGIDANDTSFQERIGREILTEREFTYGEVNFESFIPMVDFAKPQPGEIFFDMGCGSGQPLMVAALAFPKLAKCVGVELLVNLATLGQKVTSKLNALSAEAGVECAPMTVIQGDMFEADW